MKFVRMTIRIQPTCNGYPFVVYNFKNDYYSMIKIRLLICLILGFSCYEFYGQKQSEVFRKNQIDIFFGGSSIKKSYDGTTVGAGIDHRFEKLLMISGQVLVNRKYLRLLSESNLYYNIDLLTGFYRTFNKIDISINSGIGLALRNEGDIVTNKEESYKLLSIPVRLKINYLIKQRFSAGLCTYANINSGNSLYCLNINIGYRF